MKKMWLVVYCYLGDDKIIKIELCTTMELISILSNDMLIVRKIVRCEEG